MRMLMLLCATLLLGACATPQPPQAPLAPIDWQAAQARIPPGHALLFVVRPWKPSGHRNLYRIRVNGTPLMGGGMPVRSYFSCIVGPVPMLVEAQAVDTVRNIQWGLPMLDIAHLKIRPKPGEMVFLRVSSDAEGGPLLEPVKPAEGKALAARAHALKVCP